jgi:large subunit ribosomal protein L6
MSRVGNKPIPLPKGVTFRVGKELELEGPKGKLTVPIPKGITIEETNGELAVKRASGKLAALHGLTRALASNAIAGVERGWTKELDIVGIGYRAEAGNGIATFQLGYSHSIEYRLPDGVDVKVDKQTHLVVSGIDKQAVGQVAANIRSLRPPEPYKNKGVRYTGERLRKKVGKAGAGGGK